MVWKTSVASRNGMLDAYETSVGPNPILEVRSGAAPANTAASNSGTVLATLALPADWMAAAANASKAKSGVWQDLAADAAGTAGHFRIFASDGVTCHGQGTITATGGGGDMELNNTVLAAGQEFTVTSFTIVLPDGA